jgi:hypothetical protein
LGPELDALLGVRELNAHAHAIAGSTYGTLQHRVYPELPPYLLHVEIATPLERVRRRARRDLEPGKLAERVRELVGHAVREILLRRVAADVQEREDRDGLGARRGRGHCRLVPP